MGVVCGSIKRAASGGPRRRPGHVAATGKEADDRDILVERGPVDTGAAEAEVGAFGGRGMEEAREPGERHADGAAVVEVDPEAMLVEADGGRRLGEGRDPC